MLSKSLGVFGLISMVITVGIVLWLHVGKGEGSVPHDVAAVQAADRAVTAMIPGCSEAENSCKSPGWSQLTATVMRRMGLSPGSCIVCSESGGEKKVTLRMMGGAERAWFQDASGNIRDAGRGGPESARPGAPIDLPAAPAAPDAD